MPNMSDTNSPAITGVQRVAYLMLALGEERAAAVLGQLTPMELQKVVGAMMEIKAQNPAVTQLVLVRFFQQLGIDPAKISELGI
jgi:flagellar motor switch protein FliG